MQAQALIREFKYNSVKLADPSPDFTLQQVRDFFANVYPEIINADIEGPQLIGDKHAYTFRRAVGTKGGGVLRAAFERAQARAGAESPSTRMIMDLAALDKIGGLRTTARAASMIRISAEFVAEKPDFALSTKHVQRIAELHAQHCRRANEVRA